jgi:hypothetical protein
MRPLGPSKQWVEILSVSIPDKQVEARLGDGGPIVISIHDVPPAFRWPKEGEWWSVTRDALSSNLWTLGARVHGRTSYVVGGERQVALNEKVPITQMQEGELRLDAERITDALGRRLLHLGEGGGAGSSPEFYVQASAPVDAVPPYLWIQTGTPVGGWTLWFDDGT